MSRAGLTCVLGACLALLSLCASPPAHALVVLSYHDVRDDAAPKGDPDPFATSTANFVAQLDWLRAHGYVAVSAQQVRDARAGRARLPDKAVLLTFDDGLRSVYTRVFPLLRAYRWPALVAPVTSWVDLPAGATVDYGPRPFTRDDFVTWAQLKQMQDSGLVEVASHSHALHTGVRGNREGNLMPAAVTRAWDPRTGYKDEAHYLARVRADLAASADAIERGTGRRPHAVVWPYGAWNLPLQQLAAGLGMDLSFDLSGRVPAGAPASALAGGDAPTPDHGAQGVPRLLVGGNPDIADFVDELRHDPLRDGVRAIQVDLDHVYDPDPAQTERNLDALVQRIKDIGPSHVFLQAFADPDGDGAAEALYFPNRHLPMRADLFGRVAWQLQTRADVKVYAWMPVLGFDAAGTPPKIAAPDPEDIPRLDPSRPETLRFVCDLYEDLAVHASFSGLLFHDDAYLREDELPGYGGGDPAARTRRLVQFTHRLEAAAERWRPRLATVRNLFAEPVLDARAQRWFAQDLGAFNAAYDYTALMAMPRMEGAADGDAWLQRLAAAVARAPDGTARTIFELQAYDWRRQAPVPADELRRQARALAAAGARHLGYYPDDFVRASPPLSAAREAASARAFPYLER